MSEADDKRELLRLKQGLIEESSIIKEEKPVFPKLHGKKKIENFFYHYKLHLFFAIFITVSAAFLSYDVLSKEKADLKVIVCTSSSEAKRAVYEKTEDIEVAFEELCLDYDENGYAFAEVFVLDVTQNEYSDPNLFVANSTRLFGEMQAGSGQLMLGNLDVFYNVLGQGEEITFLTDLTVVFPDDDNVYEKFFYRVKGSLLAETAGWDNCPEDMYFAVRIPSATGTAREQEKNKEFHTRSLDFLSKMLNG